MASTEIVKVAEGKLAEFAQQMATSQVTNQEEYAAVCSLVVMGRSEVKKIGFVLDPGISSAREHLNLLLNQKKGFVEKWEQQIAIGAGKAATWKEEERRKAEAEQRRINEERRIEAQRKADEERKERERLAEEERKRVAKEAEAARKAGEIGKREAERLKREADAAAAREKERAAEDARQAKADAVTETVTVKPAVPVVAGIRARVNWKFRVMDETKIPRQFMIMIRNDVKIGQMVRECKNKALAESQCPGIEVYSEDAV